MNTLTDNLLLFDRLNEQQIGFISGITQQVRLQKNEYFIEPGHYWSHLAFVEKGVLRYNYYNKGAQNITSSLIGEGNFVVGTGSLIIPILQSEYLQAMTDCTLLVLDKNAIAELSATVSNWDGIFRKLSQKASSERRKRIINFFEISDPEKEAVKYLDRFDDLHRNLTVDQVLPYFKLRSDDQAVGS